MAEIQRVQDVPTPTNGGWEAAISEWETGVSQELMGALRQMRAAYYVRESFGREGVEKFAQDVHARKSKVYAYASTFEALAEIYEDPSTRVESSPLTPWQLVAAVKRGVAEEDVEGSLGRAEQGETVREINSETKDKAEVVSKTRVCPQCGGSGEIPVDEGTPVPDVPDVPRVEG